MPPPLGQITINGTETPIEPGETILSAARRLGIEIPTLCFLEGRKVIESCGLCLVEVEGHSGLLPACASKALPGMSIRTDSPQLHTVRKTALELLFSDHLGDCLAPCERACPAHIDIPGFIREIRRGNPSSALALIRESIALVGVLGRICPKFCERVCRRAEIDDPVPICSLKRYPADHDIGLDNPMRQRPAPSTGRSVAIVGGGIVGLTAAYYLAKEGHACRLYESRYRLGGAIDEVIPEFRMPRDVLSFEIAEILELGVRVETGRTLGVNLDLESLSRDHDAVLLAIGAGRETPPEVKGSEFGLSALELLKQVGLGEAERVHGSAVVVGGGPTALDAARTLLRLGADPVTLAMAPSIDSSLFFKTWIPDGIAEGVQILDRLEDLSIENRAHSLRVLHFSRDGVQGSLETRHLFLAGGVAPDLNLLKSLGLDVGPHGIKVDRRTQATNLEGVFAAGNIAQAGRYAIQGSAAGCHAAEAVARFLRGETEAPNEEVDVRLPHLSDEEWAVLFAGVNSSSPRAIDCVVDPPASFDFSEVRPGFVEGEARHEAQRCLQCDCAAKKECLLRIRGTQWKANPRAYGGERPRYERDDSHPEIVYEPGKCIKCGRCVAVARDREEELGLTYIGRGFDVRIGVPLNQEIHEGLRKAGRACAEVCPTGALSLKR